MLFASAVQNSVAIKLAQAMAPVTPVAEVMVTVQAIECALINSN